MIACIFRCLTTRSKSTRISLLLNQLVNLDNRYLSSLYYFYFFLSASISRKKVHKFGFFQKTINEWIGVNPQFFEFLNMYTSKFGINLIETLFKV